MGIPSGLVLRVDRVRAPDGSGGSGSGGTTGFVWKFSLGQGRVFDQPAEWAAPQFRRLDQPYRDYVTDRLMLPWWLLVVVLGAAPARWTFVRLRRAHRADRGRCPECGGELQLVDEGRCATCGAVVGEIAA
jgi:hypothetical protein